MTFASTFGRVLSPTFQPKSQAAGGKWWLAGNINPANCIAAYQPKGAASYAASKVNLANPGTYDATGGNAPDWDATNGWKFDGVNDYLDTGILPSQTWSVLIRYSDTAFTSSTRYFMGLLDRDPAYTRFYLSGTTSSISFGNGGQISYSGSSDRTLGVIGISAQDGYQNGVDVIDIPTDKTDYGFSIYIGCRNDSGTAAGYMNFYLQAFAIYNAALTSTQVGLLTTAMNAL